MATMLNQGPYDPATDTVLSSATVHTCIHDVHVHVLVTTCRLQRQKSTESAINTRLYPRQLETSLPDLFCTNA